MRDGNSAESLNDAVEVAVSCGRHSKTLDDRPTQVRHRAVATARRRVIEILTDAGCTATLQRYRRTATSHGTAESNVTIQLTLLTLHTCLIGNVV